MSLTILLMLTVSLTFHGVPDLSLANNSESCEYDLDLTKNTVKITCQGSPSVVNVYAEKALLQSDENSRNSLGEAGYGKPSMGGGESQNMETESTGAHPEKQTSSNSGSINPGDPLIFQKDRFDMAYKSAGAFSEVVWKAKVKLDKAKQSLSTYTDSIKNITVKLSEGDLLLRADMEKLRRTSNSATDLKGGIIAAMTNQYNFMRSALLARNYELEKLVASLNVLVDVTADGLHSALMAHRFTMDEVTHVNTTLLAIKKMVSRELMKREVVKDAKGKKYDKCPKEISAIGAGTYIRAPTPKGAYMVQSANPSEFRSVFTLEGINTADQLKEYHATIDVEPDLVGKYILLPYNCYGTGHVIYKRHFYCHQKDTNTIAKYHIKKTDLEGIIKLEDPMTDNSAPYSSGDYTDVDLAVDEYGLWAIYANRKSAGKIVISKIDHKNMKIGPTYYTKYPKKQIGNAFMICGVLYGINSHKDTPTFVRLIYNTETGSEQILEKGILPFSNSALIGMSDGAPRIEEDRSSYTVMLSYDYRTSSLYSWNNGRIETFPVYFKATK